MAGEKRPPTDKPESAIDRLLHAVETARDGLRQPGGAAPTGAAYPNADPSGRKNIFGEPYQGGLFGRGGTLGLGLGADPWETTMQRTVTPGIKSLGGERAETVSKYVLPQNAPELAAAALTAGSPVGGLFGKGVVAGAKGATGVLGRAAIKALETGAASGLTASQTGHDVGTSAMGGAVGGALGQAAGEGAKAIAQTAASSGMVTKATEGVSKALQTIFGDARLPPGTNPTKVLRSVINGEIVTDLQKEIGDLGASYAKKKVPGMTGTLKTLWQDVDLRPQLIKHLSPADQKVYRELVGELQRTTLVQDWVTGGLTPAQARKALTDETGRLTTEGLAQLQSRFGDFQKGLEKAFGADKAKQLASSIYQDLAQGTRVGIAGEAPKPTISLIPKVHLGLEGGRLPWQPGWEKTAGALAADVVPGALKAGGLEAPVKYFGADIPGKPAPAAPATSPAPVMPELTPPPPARPTPPSYYSRVEPPPMQPSPPAGWFNPEAAPEAESTPAPAPLTPALPVPKDFR